MHPAKGSSNHSSVILPQPNPDNGSSHEAKGSIVRQWVVESGGAALGVIGNFLKEAVLLPCDVALTYLHPRCQHPLTKGGADRLEGRIVALNDLVLWAADYGFLKRYASYFDVDQLGHRSIKPGALQTLHVDTAEAFNIILARCNERTDSFRQSLDDYQHMSPPTKTAAVISIVGPWVMPSLMKMGVVKGTHCWNKHIFGLKNKPPIHAPLTLSEFEAYPGGATKLTYKEAMRYKLENELRHLSEFQQAFTETESMEMFLYVIDKKGKLILAPEFQFLDPKLVPAGTHDKIIALPGGKFALKSCHAYLIEGEATAAGMLVLEKGKFAAASAGSGHFKPSGMSLEPVLRRALERSGCSEAYIGTFNLYTESGTLNQQPWLDDNKFGNRFPHPGAALDQQRAQFTGRAAAVNSVNVFLSTEDASRAPSSQPLPQGISSPSEEVDDSLVSVESSGQTSVSAEWDIPSATPKILPDELLSSSLIENYFWHRPPNTAPKNPYIPQAGKSRFDVSVNPIPGGAALKAGACVASIAFAEGAGYTAIFSINIGFGGGAYAGALLACPAFAIATGVLLAASAVVKKVQNLKIDKLHDLESKLRDTRKDYDHIVQIQNQFNEILSRNSMPTQDDLNKINGWGTFISKKIGKVLDRELDTEAFINKHATNNKNKSLCVEDLFLDENGNKKPKSKHKLSKNELMEAGAIAILKEEAGYRLFYQGVLKNIRQAQKDFPGFIQKNAEVNHRIELAKGGPMDSLTDRLKELHQSTDKDYFNKFEAYALTQIALDKIHVQYFSSNPDESLDETNLRTIQGIGRLKGLLHITPHDTAIESDLFQATKTLYLNLMGQQKFEGALQVARELSKGNDGLEQGGSPENKETPPEAQTWIKLAQSSAQQALDQEYNGMAAIAIELVKGNNPEGADKIAEDYFASHPAAAQNTGHPIHKLKELIGQDREEKKYRAIHSEYIKLTQDKDFAKAYQVCKNFHDARPESTKAIELRNEAAYNLAVGEFYHNLNFNDSIQFAEEFMKQNPSSAGNSKGRIDADLCSKLKEDKYAFRSEILNTVVKAFFDTAGAYCIKNSGPQTEKLFKGILTSHIATPDLFTYLILISEAYPKNEMTELWKTYIKNIPSLKKGSAIIPEVISLFTGLVLRGCKVQELWRDPENKGAWDSTVDRVAKYVSPAKAVIELGLVGRDLFLGKTVEDITKARIRAGEFLSGYAIRLGFAAFEKLLPAGQLPESQLYYVITRDIAPGLLPLLIMPAYNMYQSLSNVSVSDRITFRPYEWVPTKVKAGAEVLVGAFNYISGAHQDKQEKAVYDNLTNLYEKEKGPLSAEFIIVMNSKPGVYEPVNDKEDSAILKETKLFCFETTVKDFYNKSNYAQVLIWTKLSATDSSKAERSNIDIAKIPTSMLCRLGALLMNKDSSRDDIERILYSADLKMLKEPIDPSGKDPLAGHKQQFMLLTLKYFLSLYQNPALRSQVPHIILSACDRLEWAWLKYGDASCLGEIPSGDLNHNDKILKNLSELKSQGDELLSKLNKEDVKDCLKNGYILARNEMIERKVLVFKHRQSLLHQSNVLEKTGLCINSDPAVIDSFYKAVADQLMIHAPFTGCKQYSYNELREIGINYVKANTSEYSIDFLREVYTHSAKLHSSHEEPPLEMKQAICSALKLNLVEISLEGPAAVNPQLGHYVNHNSLEELHSFVSTIAHVHKSIGNMYLGYKNGQYISLVVDPNATSSCNFEEIIAKTPTLNPPSLENSSWPDPGKMCAII